MRVLLDTHCWLWMQAQSARLSQKTRALLQDPENEIFLSAASSWEIAIKYALGKLPRRFIEHLSKDSRPSGR